MKKSLFENNSLTYREEKGRYTTILSECRFNEYLHEIDLEANQMLDSIISHLAAERGIDAGLKVRDMFRWVTEMNNIKASFCGRWCWYEVDHQ